MRKKLLTLLLAVAAGIGTMFAEKVKIGDLYYNLDATNQTAEVTYRSYTNYKYNEGWDITTAIIPASVTYNEITYSVTSIGYAAFSDCSGLTSVTIPNSVTSIGFYAFYDCTGLTSVTIPNSVTSIGKYAFYNCSGLTSVTIPNSVTSIVNYAFSDCSGLTSVTIPNSVTSIGSGAFSGCSGLTSINVVTDNPNYCSVEGVLFNKYKTVLVQCPGGKEGDYTIPNSVTSIGNDAFRDCTGLTSVTIPNSVTTIDNYAFSGCSGLTSVTIPNRVTGIGWGAFYGCSGLTSVTIPNSVTSIGWEAFNQCSNLKHIISMNTTPPSITSNTFTGIAPEAVALVPNDALSDYMLADNWKDMFMKPFISAEQNINSTSANITLTNNIWDLENDYIASCAVEGGEQFAGNVLEYNGLEPNSKYANIPVVLTSNTGETETVNVSFSTTVLTLTTQPSKPVSSSTAILLAQTNMADIETSCGFEYKRNDAPADMDGTKVFCPVASGQMAGRLKNLKDDVYYKYRAFYQSAAGNMYYGDWQYIFTGDVAVEFDPILYTYGATVVKENEATISGYALAGSEDFTEQGFEYWAETRANNGANAPHRMPAALGEHFFVQASGIALRATLTNLDAGTIYRYRVYGKVGDQYYYGSEQTFTTTGTYTPPTYTITFANWDGTELQSSQVEEGTLPEYTGATPERPEDEQYTYSFNGWTPTIVIASADATYTATYTATPKSQGIEDVQGNNVQCTKIVHNGQILILRGDKTYTLQGQEVK